jgi:hypothetical protein
MALPNPSSIRPALHNSGWSSQTAERTTLTTVLLAVIKRRPPKTTGRLRTNLIGSTKRPTDSKDSGMRTGEMTTAFAALTLHHSDAFLSALSCSAFALA